MNLIFNLLWWIAIPALTAKLVISLMVLSMDTKNIYEAKVLKAKQSFAFPKFFDDQVITTKKKKRDLSKKSQNIEDISLKAIYISKNQKFIMISDKKKIVFINLNQRYKDMKLISIDKNFAKFIKNGEYIKLFLQSDKKNSDKKSIPKKEITKNSYTSEDEGYITIQRKYFDKYTKNLNKLIRDIRIKELKSKDEFKGIEITFVRKNSLFDNMKLKRGDVIQEIERKRLKSMKDIFFYYRRLKSITSLQIGLERDGEMKEIVYEID